MSLSTSNLPSIPDKTLFSIDTQCDFQYKPPLSFPPLDQHQFDLAALSTILTIVESRH
jgi:hypothetical protein